MGIEFVQGSTTTIIPISAKQYLMLALSCSALKGRGAGLPVKLQKHRTSSCHHDGCLTR